MNEKKELTNEELENKCAACSKITDHTGMTIEGEEYIMHFCGEECYEYWRKKHKSEKKS